MALPQRNIHRRDSRGRVVEVVHQPPPPNAKGHRDVQFLSEL